MRNGIIASLFLFFFVSTRTILAVTFSLRGTDSLSGNEEVAATKKEEDNNIPRVVTFGSSRTWGAGIEDHEKKSYAGLLNATNLAIRGSGPEYPAMCLYSMMDDDAVYDVIVIEFMLDWMSDALVDLAVRVRHRFPHSTIVFLNFWAPRQYIYKPTGRLFQDFYKERATRWDGFFDHTVLDRTSNDDWVYQPYNRSIIEQAAWASRGYIIDLDHFANDPIQSLHMAGNYYLTDMTHWNENGHAYIDGKITQLLRNTGFDKSKTTVNDWDSTDFCTLWYESGKTDFPTTMLMNEFKPGKFALEATVNENKNKIEIENPWGKDAGLYVSYMATAPDRMYPEGVVRVVHRDDRNFTAHMKLNTYIPNVQQQLHIVMHWKVGTVAPGKNNILIKLLEEDPPNPWNVVRLVGIILSPHTYGGTGRISANF